MFAETEGATHAYMLGSAGCWAAFGEVLAREYADPVLFAASHRLTVDAYALQHPGLADDRRARQSVWVHFASLDRVLRAGLSLAAAADVLKEPAGRSFPPLPSAPIWQITVADVASTKLADHATIVERWARHAHAGWAPALQSGTLSS